MPTYSYAFFISAVGFLFAGIGVGLFMVITENHALTPAHAHINLLGWVSSALMGLFYALAGERLPRRLIWTQYGLYTAGVAALSLGLAAMLSGVKAIAPLMHAGLAATLGGVVLFGWAIFKAAYSETSVVLDHQVV